MSDLSVTNILSIYSQPQVFTYAVGGYGYGYENGATLNYYN